MSSGGGRREDTLSLTEVFEAEARAPLTVSDTIHGVNLQHPYLLCKLSRRSVIASIPKNPDCTSDTKEAFLRYGLHVLGQTISYVSEGTGGPPQLGSHPMLFF